MKQEFCDRAPRTDADIDDLIFGSSSTVPSDR